MLSGIVTQKKTLKGQTRAKRLGATRERRIRVSDNIPIPKGKEWQAFLKVNENKEELFRYLSEEMVKTSTNSNYHFISTKGEFVLSNKPVDLSRINPSDHEEADTRMILHLYDAVTDGHETAFLRTVDSDVVILCIRFYHTLHGLGLKELWIGFGAGKHYKDIPIHEVANLLGPERSMAILFFHAFTGCDVTSSFLGIGKKTAWNVWLIFPEVTLTMIALTEDPNELTEDSVHMQRLERFTVLMYSKSSNCTMVNEARQSMFIHNLKSLDSIPPTQAALFQHCKRTVLIASFIWQRSLQRLLSLPDFSLHGWEWNDRLNSWVPYWTVLDDVSSACALMLHCGCKTSCVKNCAKAGLRWMY